MAKSVTVLMGGWSGEREVSLVSGRTVAAALGEAGYEARTVDIGRDPRAIAAALEPRPDVVFNALHGPFGEDGRVQGILDLLEIPYTHSGVLASALAMDKPMAKRLFGCAGIRCAEHVIVSRSAAVSGDALPRPYVVKPLREGSSLGVSVVTEGSDPCFAADGWAYGDTVMVERYVPGREITVAVMGDRALGVTEIRPLAGFYDYRAKYTEGATEHLIPAPIPADAYDTAMRFSVDAHKALGCRGVSRADLRYDDAAGGAEGVYLLEVNTQPGMTPMSLVPELAAHAGIDFPALVSWMVEHAACDA